MIRVTHLTKHYGTTVAVDDISFEIARGEILGFLGPNGAGKTTTMKILTGFLPATSGKVEVEDMNIDDHSLQIRRRMGYLPESAPLYDDMEVLAYLQFAAEMREIPKPQRTSRIKSMIEVCGLGGVLRKDIGELSKGYRQRVGLAQAMIHNPEFIILDEPTSGLDPNQIVEIRNLIIELGREKTVVLSTHILPEVQATCSRIVIINEGKLVADGSPAELQSRMSTQQKLRAMLIGPSAAIRTALKGLAPDAKVEFEKGDDEAYVYTVTTLETADLRPALSQLVSANGWTLLELRREVTSLEDVFRSLTVGDTAHLKSNIT